MPIHPEHLTNVVGRIESIASQATRISERFDRHRLVFITEEGLGFSLNDEARDLYERLTKEFLNKLKWSEKYTEKRTSENIKNLIVMAIQNTLTEEIKNVLEQQIRDYDALDCKSYVYVPISGIRVLKQIKLFGVVFKPSSERLKKRILKKFQNVIDKTLNDNESKKGSSEAVAAYLSDVFKFPTVAECVIVAEPDRAEQIALSRTRGILDVIRVAIPLICPPNHKVKVGIGDEVTFSSLPIVSVSSESANINESRLGPLSLFNLDKNSIKKLRQQGLFNVFSLQNKSDLTEVEELYLRAIHWLGDSQNQPEVENKVLSLVTCLETFFTPEKDSSLPISNTVSESIALLMFKGFDKRKNVKRRVKELYDLRSRITHGSKIVITDKDLTELMNFSYAVTRFISQKLNLYKQRKDIQTEVETKKLS